ncbi:hypothetical protein L249_2676 [Ophiocordyceps polyrhachis-furcata BCC 54312]|uniref:Zn(2)-C6 fungal-type domain-containing protein n=1 Tax=Ophiocordyceps polyrhachis-furcata BCC 54312 TaxID=1330021 RepID=A0A367LSF2_9HYPO|nr:hypothetical protein L249_2676 [Ophiocordyceps polyrhachis-furcata BCC 54312]
MSPSRQGEPEEASGLTYPSPSAEALDAGPFYHANARDGPPEHADQSVQHGQHGAVHGQGPDQGQMPPPDSASPPQHVSRPANLEELQLAAQLGDGLAGNPLMPATDPNMNVDEHGMRNIMPHPEPEHHQAAQYVHDTSTTDHLALPVGPPQYQMNDGVPPRKRSKVSRACDECRRKKIKCDAQSDSGDTPCSSCARSSIRCLFSRVPQKRGPSKGYIKEIADRLSSLENRLESEGNLTQDDIDKLFASDRPRSHEHGDEMSRKRPYSSISTGDVSTPVTTRQAPWGSEPRPPASSEGFSHEAYPNSALAPQATAIKPETTPSKPPVASMDASMADVEEVLDVDEGALKEYLSTVQPAFPILPSNTWRMQSLLSQCPSSLREAFRIALLAATQQGGDVKHADALLREWENGDGPSSRAADMVHSQTLLLLSMDADRRGLSTLPSLLARAVALANSTKLWKLGITDATDGDSDDAMALRIWWSLILMDRWHAAGTGKPLLIPNSSVVAGAGLMAVLGEVCFYLTRLSKVVGNIASALSRMPAGATAADETVTAILGDYVDDFREDLPAHVDVTSFPLVHLAYWHCRLLVTLLTPGMTALEMMWPARELSRLLLTGGQRQSPLTRHFASLAAVCLTKLAKMDRTREEATQRIRDMVEAAPDGHWDRVQARLAEQLRPPSSAEATASQGLQHLADLATAHEGMTVADGEVAFGPVLAAGYLSVP